MLVEVDFELEVGAGVDVYNVLEVDNDFEDVNAVVKDVDDGLADEDDELEEIDVCKMLILKVVDCGSAQPPIIDGTAFSPVVINVIFEPQLAA